MFGEKKYLSSITFYILIWNTYIQYIFDYKISIAIQNTHAMLAFTISDLKMEYSLGIYNDTTPI